MAEIIAVSYTPYAKANEPLSLKGLSGRTFRRMGKMEEQPYSMQRLMTSYEG